MKKYVLPLLLLFSISCEDSIMTPDSSRYYALNFNDSYAPMTGQPQGDRYNEFVENQFINVSDVPISTFSIDADGGSYSNVRRFLSEGAVPPAAAVRTEELINYFPLDYAEDDNGHPISLSGEVSACPWKPEHKLIRIGIKAKSVPREALPPSNLVLLIDVSGSMSDPDKLELLKSGFLLLVDELSSSDRIAIVTYAGQAGVALPATAGGEKTKIADAINSLGSRGSTAGAEGIRTAYAIAEKNFIEGGNNRVILGTDGDFNVGVSSQDELVKLIESERDKGVFLTTIGVGRGNLNDGMLEQVADHGNGTYEYIDNINQAKKVFVDEYSKFYPAAKDVKVQIEFNPLVVDSYRLIGYENRLLESKDFEDDTKDAGEISIGQNVTALYEINPRADGSAFRTNPAFTIQFRYKLPAQDTSIPLSLRVFDEGRSFMDASESMRFTASVAGFGLLLRHSTYKGSLTYNDVLQWTAGAMTFDPFNRRAAFAELIRMAGNLE
jgi:Ca-activated chloride channel family protein